MAHPDTEAAEIQSDEANEEVETEDFELATPHVTKAMTVDEGAAEIAKILEAEDRPEVPATDKGKKEDVKEDTPPPPEASVDDDEAEEAEEKSEDEAETDTDTDETEEATEDEEPGEPAEVIPPPVSWSKEHQNIFATLPPEAQQIIVDRERERDRGFQEKATELANERQQMKAFEQQLVNERQQSSQYIANLLGQNLVRPDPRNYQDDPYQYRQDMEVFEQRYAQYQQMQQAADQNRAWMEQQEQQEKHKFQNERNEKLKELLPEFDDYQYKTGVFDYGLRNGIPEESFEYATAEEIVLLDKARRWDALQSSKKDLKPKLEKAPKVQKPGAQSKGGARRSLDAARKKLKQSGSVHDAARVIEQIL